MTPKSLPLRLGALARAAGDRRLELVRRAQAPVAQLELDGQAAPSPARRSGTRSMPTHDFTVRSALP